MAGEHGVLSAAQRDQIRILHENGVRLQELLEGRTGEARTPEPEDIEALTMSADIDIDQSSGRILIADDHAGMRQYLGRLLGRRWKVEVVPDGRAALAAARARRPDLVIADVEMPVLGGFGLVQQLRGDSRTSTIPVLLVSGQAGEDSRIKRSPTGDTPGSA